METPTQACREKIRLMDEYDRTTAEFSRTVAVLNKHQGVLLKNNCQAILATCDRTRLDS